jgi:hypothetical protein
MTSLLTLPDIYIFLILIVLFIKSMGGCRCLAYHLMLASMVSSWSMVVEMIYVGYILCMC